jgi:hypothetical protein
VYEDLNRNRFHLSYGLQKTQVNGQVKYCAADEAYHRDQQRRPDEMAGLQRLRKICDGTARRAEIINLTMLAAALYRG